MFVIALFFSVCSLGHVLLHGALCVPGAPGPSGGALRSGRWGSLGWMTCNFL